MTECINFKGKQIKRVWITSAFILVLFLASMTSVPLTDQKLNGSRIIFMEAQMNDWGYFFLLHATIPALAITARNAPRIM